MLRRVHAFFKFLESRRATTHGTMQSVEDQQLRHSLAKGMFQAATGVHSSKTAATAVYSPSLNCTRSFKHTMAEMAQEFDAAIVHELLKARLQELLVC
jgi:hypothetical protein